MGWRAERWQTAWRATTTKKSPAQPAGLKLNEEIKKA
jgi:hypothetical protein